MIDTKALRGRILDLAIHGKLTEQLESDGTAAELYQQIQAEKQKSFKAKKPTATSKLSYDIPPNWYSCTFDSINSFVSKTTTPLNNPDATYELYSVPNYPLKKPEILKGGDIGSAKQLLQENDVLVCKINPRINRVWIVTRHTDHMIIGSSEWIPFRNNHIDPQYLFYYFQSPFFRTYMQSNLSGVGGSLTRAKPEFVKQYPVLLPPLAEQKRIVARVEEIFRLLDTIDAAQEHYAADVESLKAKLITVGIQGKLTEQLASDGTAEELYQQIQAEKQRLIKEGKLKKEKPLPEIKPEEVPFDIPRNWKWVRLDDITSKIASGNTPKGGIKGGAYVPTGNCFFREQNIYNDGIHYDGMVYISDELLNTRPNSTVLPNDILLNITGGSIGRCAIIPPDFGKGSINQHILIIRLINDNMLYYIHQIMCSPYIQKLIRSKAVGDKDGFSGGRCKATLIPLPPLAEQKRIADKLDELLAAMT